MTAGLAALLSLAQQHIPSATLVEESGREAVINLPQTAAKDSSLGVFLSELDQRLTDLGISSYGLSDSTLEEVRDPLKQCKGKRFTSSNFLSSKFSQFIEEVLKYEKTKTKKQPETF